MLSLSKLIGFLSLKKDKREPIAFQDNFYSEKHNSSPVFFHEDFYRQIELVPEENLLSTQQFINDLPEDPNASEYGFYKITSREGLPLVTIYERKITLQEISSIFSPLSYSIFNTIQTGYGSRATFKVDNCIAWGFERFGIFVDYDKEYIKNIWICYISECPQNNDDYKNLFAALLTISVKYNLILIDWDIHEAVSSSSEDMLKKYLDFVFF